VLRRRPRHRHPDPAGLSSTFINRLTRAGLAPALVVLLAAGCGGDEDDPVTTSGPLVPSKRDYIVQADTICIRQREAIEGEAEVALGIDSGDFTVRADGEIVFKPGRRPPPARIERFGTDVVLPALRDQLTQLRALPPPEGDEDAVAAIYDTAERGLDRLTAEPSLFNDRGAVRRELSRARRLGRCYGFFECGTYSGP
jgi:hypothetical protein